MIADGQCWSEASAADDQHCEHSGEDLRPGGTCPRVLRGGESMMIDFLSFVSFAFS